MGGQRKRWVCSSYKHTLGQWSGGGRHLFESSTGSRSNTCSGEGEETLESLRQRRKRTEKCGFYFTAFVILPSHAKKIAACV